MNFLGLKYSLWVFGDLIHPSVFCIKVENNQKEWFMVPIDGLFVIGFITFLVLSVVFPVVFG